MNGRLSGLCRVSLFGVLIISSLQAQAWRKSNDPIAEKHNADQLVYRPDARFDRPQYQQYESPKLTQQQNQWVWNSEQKRRIDHRPWGNYDFSGPQQATYYLPEYQREVAKYRYPVANNYLATEPVYRVSYPRATYQRVQASTYPQYATDYDHRYYQSAVYPVQTERPARVYQVTDPTYAYSPAVVDHSNMDYYISPYAYDMY